MKGWVAALIVFLVIALCAVGTGIVFYLWGESEWSEGWDRGYGVGYGEAYGIASSEGYSEGYDAGWAVRQAEPLQLFESLVELSKWVSQDDTSDIPYADDVFDCDDFAMRLSQNAADAGYFIGVYLEKEAGHMKNFAYTKSKTNVIYLIEPQRDWIKPLWID